MSRSKKINFNNLFISMGKKATEKNACKNSRRLMMRIWAVYFRKWKQAAFCVRGELCILIWEPIYEI
jgi:hypothetical protein